MAQGMGMHPEPYATLQSVHQRVNARRLERLASLADRISSASRLVSGWWRAS